MRFALMLPLVPLLLVHAAQAADKPVRFVVLTPDLADNQPEKIYLASSANDWNAGGDTLPQVAPGVFVGTVKLRAGREVEYKFTRTGVWSSVEKTAKGGERKNRKLTVEPDLKEQIVVCIVERWADRSVPADRRIEIDGYAPGPGEHTLTGDIRLHKNFKSPQLGNERTLAVYLPPEYAEQTDQRYPVLYMHDGQNLFDAATSYSGTEWEADETAQRLIKAGHIKPLIIVGIYNTEQRADEYTPWKDTERDAGGQGDAYLRFVIETVKPFIDKTYRTKPEREDTSIAGSSLGGIISLYAVHEHEDVFSKAGVVSPALWWAQGRMLQYLEAAKPRHKLRIWVDIGTAEGDGKQAEGLSAPVALGRELSRILSRRRPNPGLDYIYEEIPHGGHHEADWAARFDRVLLYLFGEDVD